MRLHAPNFLRQLLWNTRPGGQVPLEDRQSDTGDQAARGGATPVRVTVIDYSLERVETEEAVDLAEFLARHRPEWSHVRWINVDGIADTEAIHALAEKYQLHPLAVEDVLHNKQRPKAEDYHGSGDHPGRLFVVARAVEMADGRLRSDQISFFLGRNTLLTFREFPADDFDDLRKRLSTAGSRVRQNDASFLLYALIDATVDGYFPILEHYSERLEYIERSLLEGPEKGALHSVHAVKRELLLIRRAVWPMREMIAQLLRERHECLSETARTYFRDVYDHCVQILDLLEHYRETASALTETYMSAISNRMNEIIKVLTIFSAIFIPLTFLAGVYGMNMPIPENRWEGTYWVFWIVCALIAGGMLLWFRWRRWL
jgi:magnesium transporter